VHRPPLIIKVILLSKKNYIVHWLHFCVNNVDYQWEKNSLVHWPTIYFDSSHNCEHSYLHFLVTLSKNMYMWNNIFFRYSTAGSGGLVKFLSLKTFTYPPDFTYPPAFIYPPDVLEDTLSLVNKWEDMLWLVNKPYLFLFTYPG
jgi:hypothetical protein